MSAWTENPKVLRQDSTEKQSSQITSLVKETEKLRFQIIKKKYIILLLQYFLLVDAGFPPGILNFISH